MFTVIIIVLIVISMFVILTNISYNYVSCNEDEIDVKSKLIEEDMKIKDIEFIPETNPTTMKISLERGRSKVKIEAEDIPEPPPLDIILVSDVSGSMEWCDDISESEQTFSFFNINENLYCGDRRFISVDEATCPKTKLDLLVEAEKMFVDKLKTSHKTQVGIVEYSSSQNVARYEKPDLTATLKVGPDNSCFEPNYFMTSLDDTSWYDYTAVGSKPWAPNANRCQNCKVFFRKNFNIDDKTHHNDLKLYLAHSGGIICYLNEKEVYHYPSFIYPGYWNKVQQIPSSYLNNGDNLLSCMVSTDKYYNKPYAFDAELVSNRDVIVPRKSTWKFKINMDDCIDNADAYNPEIIWSEQDQPNNFYLYATIKNDGKGTTDDFIVRFWDENFEFSDDILVHGLGPKEGRMIGTTANLNLDSDRKFYVEVDSTDVIDEMNEANNIDFVISKTYINEAELLADAIGNDNHWNFYVCNPGAIPNPILLKARVYNSGTKDITTPFTVKFYLGTFPAGVLIHSLTLPGLAGLTKVTTTPYEWHDHGIVTDTPMYVVVDEEGAIPEIDETNNYLQGTIKYSYPDLYVRNNDYRYINLVNPVCSDSVTDIDIMAREYNYRHCIAGPHKIGVSLDGVNYLKADVDHVNFKDYGEDGFYENFNDVPIDLTGKTSFQLYVRADVDNEIIEYSGTPAGSQDGDSSNNAVRTFYIGPNLEFDTTNPFTVFPEAVKPGEAIDYDFTINYHNYVTACNSEIGNFDIKFYQDLVDPAHLIHTYNTNIPTGTYSFTETLTLNSDTTIYAVLDSEDVVSEYYEGANNMKSVNIDVDINNVGTSIIPTSIFDSGKFLDLLGVTSSCPSNVDTTSVDLFNGNHVVRYFDLNENMNEVADFLDNAEGWGGTCICCGIQKAIDMFNSEIHAETPNRVLVILSDGDPDDIICNGLGNNGIESAILNAELANKTHHITVYTIGFGDDVSETIMQDIADAGEGQYFLADAETLADTFFQLAGHISTASEPIKTFQHIKVIVEDEDGNIIVKEIPFETLPQPFETKTISIDVTGELVNPVKVEINAATKSTCRDNIVSHILDTWKV